MSPAEPRDVQRLVDAWNRRDLEAMLAIAAPDVEYVNSPSAVEPGTRLGRNEYEAVLHAQWESVGDAQLEIRSLDARGDEALVILRMSRTFQGSPTPIEARIGMRLTYRGGQLIRQEMFPPEDPAPGAGPAGSLERGPRRRAG